MDYLPSKARKALKKLLKTLNKNPLLILSFGLFLFLSGASHYYQERILSFNKVPESNTSQKGEVPVQITIPSINIDMKVDIGEIKDGVWKVSYDNPTFLNTSSRPSGGGNIVIYGHNKKAIFGNLPYLSLGQEIIIKTKDNKIHKYVAYQKDFVSPDRVDLVSPTNKEELTIYTCWGLFDSSRAVIKAKPILQ